MNYLAFPPQAVFQSLRNLVFSACVSHCLFHITNLTIALFPCYLSISRSSTTLFLPKTVSLTITHYLLLMTNPHVTLPSETQPPLLQTRRQSDGTTHDSTERFTADDSYNPWLIWRSTCPLSEGRDTVGFRGAFTLTAPEVLRHELRGVRRDGVGGGKWVAEAKERGEERGRRRWRSRDGGVREEY